MKKLFAFLIAAALLTGAAFAQGETADGVQTADNTVASVVNNIMISSEQADAAAADPSAVILTEDGEEWIAPVDGEALSMEKDLGFVVNGVFYSVYRPVEPLMAAIGEPLETISSPSCVFVGEDFEYDYEYGSLFTSPIDSMNIWYEFYLFDAGMVTTRGVAVGDPAAKIIEKYGENYYVEGDGMYTYSLSGDPEDYASPCMIFETAEDEATGEAVIISIDVYYPTNVN